MSLLFLENLEESGMLNPSMRGLWHFLLWALPTILMGFIPMIISLLITQLNRGARFHKEFYLDGGLLFLGPALLGALYGEIRNLGLLFGHDTLSGVTIIVIAFVLLLSTVVYTHIGSRAQENEEFANDEGFMAFVKEVSWGLTFASIIYVVSVIVVYAHKYDNSMGMKLVEGVNQ